MSSLSSRTTTESVRLPGEDAVAACGGGGERASAAEAVERIVERVRSGSDEARIEAAREIRRLTKTSSRHRRQLSGTVEPLVSMLRSGPMECHEAAILALLNLAVKDEGNKIKIVNYGVLEPLLRILQSEDLNMQEYATAALLTLSASSANKPIISAAGAISLLVKILGAGNKQSKTDAVMALYNLSTIPENLNVILSGQPILSLVNLIKSCKKSSKTAEKCSALLESLVGFSDGRVSLTAVEGGVFTVVEVLEEGSLQSREHAVGALLTMCESDPSKYREVILKEGVIPGLLELTVQGTPRSRSKARVLLQLLRNTTYPKNKLCADTLENIVSNIVSQIDDDDCNIVSQTDGGDRAETAKKILDDMVQISMEQSLRHLRERAMLCIPAELPSGSCSSQVQSK